MKRVIITILAFLVLAWVAHAQELPAADVSVGYSFLFVAKGFTLKLNGGSSAVALNVNHWLGIVGDFGVYDGSLGIPGLIGETYTFGPRFSYRKWNRLAPFAQGAIGGGHANTTNAAFSARTTHLPTAARRTVTWRSITPAGSRCEGKWNFSTSARTEGWCLR